jgi:glucosylceramidase
MKMNLIKVKLVKLFFALLLMQFVTVHASHAQTVTPWLTSGDGSAKLSQQSQIVFGANSGSGAAINVNEGTTFQTMDGFGFALTQGSAEVISSLGANEQNALLNDIFGASGLGVSIIRISIAASDLSSSNYSYKESAGAPFSLNGPDAVYLIPIIKKVLAINPNIKILATPWSAPRWMKDNNAWVGGSLKTANYGDYAQYFVDYLNAMKAQGITIWGITPQNEPENPNNNPSMKMTASEQLTFINNNLGPAIRGAGYSALKIIGFDHNCDNTSYPTTVAGSSFVDGSAFHLYAGDISCLSTVRNNTGKNVYFTEQYTGASGNFSGDFSWHMRNVVLGSINNWSKTVIEWNLANNSAIGPTTVGGCKDCLGAITINSSNSYTKNVSYFIIGQISKFVSANAVRIGSSSSSGDLFNASFRNPDGSKVTVVFNNGPATSFRVVWNNQSFTYNLGQGNAITFKWDGSPVVNPPPPSPSATTGIVTAYQDCNNSGFSVGLEAGDYNEARLKSLGMSADKISAISVAQGYEVTLYDLDNFQGASYVTGTNGCITSFNDRTTSLRVKTKGDATIAGTFFLQNRSSNLYMDVTGGPSAVQDGANIQQWEKAGINQQFRLIHLGDGAYKVEAVHSGKVVDVSGFSKDDGANIHQYAYNGTPNQQFVFVPTDSGYYKLIAKHSGKVVEVEGCSAAFGANVRQWSNNNQSCGQWKLVPVVNSTFSTLIQAEDYSSMNGVQTENTSDTGGGLNVGYTDANDWLMYSNINFPDTGSYLIEYRVASAISGARISSDLEAGTTQLGELDVPNTGGWQNWVTISQTVNINAGIHNFGIFIRSGGANINWIRISKP